MLNEDELRDALLLVFANKQDLPVSTTCWSLELTNANPPAERDERCRDYRQAWPPQLETESLGMYNSACCFFGPKSANDYTCSTSNPLAPPPETVFTRVLTGSLRTSGREDPTNWEVWFKMLRARSLSFFSWNCRHVNDPDQPIFSFSL